MQKVTLPIVCFVLLVLVQCSVEANKTTKQDKGIDFSKTLDGEENESGKGQRQKIHYEKVIDGGSGNNTASSTDNSTAIEAGGIRSFQSQAGVPLQTPYSPQGGGSGGYGGSSGDSDASVV